MDRIQAGSARTWIAGSGIVCGCQHAVKPLESVKAELPGHPAYQSELEQSGALAFAGPLSDETGDHMQGTGMIVYWGESLEAARALANADPMHSSGTREFTLRRWLINEGSLSLHIKLSAQRVKL